MAGFTDVICRLVGAGIVADLILNGSFFTEKINPRDIDFVLCVDASYYETWIGDDKIIKTEFFSDCYLCVEWAPEHPVWFDGIQDRQFWENQFGHNRSMTSKGIALLELDGQLL